jgi:hypothetical protein
MRALFLLSIVAFGWVAPAQGISAGRFLLEGWTVTVDQPVWICARGAPSPEFLRIDGTEVPGAYQTGELPGGEEPRSVHLIVDWPARGPLPLHQALEPRGREWGLPSWGNRGFLGPGEYVLSAAGFAPETLHVRAPDPAERRGRAILARAWLHAEAGDSAQAARLVEGFLDLDEGSPYAEEAFLLLMDLLPHTSYHRRPKDWLSEWVALHHSHCIVGEGIRRWLARVEDEEARNTLAELVAGYPQTRAAAEAQSWLRAGPGRGP